MEQVVRQTIHNQSQAFISSFSSRLHTILQYSHTYVWSMLLPICLPLPLLIPFPFQFPILTSPYHSCCICMDCGLIWLEGHFALSKEDRAGAGAGSYSMYDKIRKGLMSLLRFLSVSCLSKRSAASTYILHYIIICITMRRLVSMYGPVRMYSHVL
jgi:hypothetical protein